MENKSMVRICSWCQKIYTPEYAEYAVGVDPKILKEMSIVDEQVKANKGKFEFTHTMCIPHMVQVYTNADREEYIESAKEKLKDIAPPCLIQNEPLRHAYMKGLFTPELIQQAVQSQQKDKQELTERLKKLAGI